MRFAYFSAGDLKNNLKVSKALKVPCKQIDRPFYRDKYQSNIIDEICIELKKITEDQLSHLEEKRRDYPVLRCLFVEFEYYTDHVYSLLVGTPSGIYLKKMIEHSKSRSI